MKSFFLTPYLVIYFIASSPLWGGGLVDKVNDSLKRNFGSDIKIEYSKFKLEPELRRQIEREVNQKFTQDFVHVFSVKKNGETAGYALVDNVFGKMKPITFAVIFDGKGFIVETAILRYRESYGGAVQNERWLSQFQNKTADKINFGKEIHGISGATISAKSVTKGIKKLSLIFEAVKNGIK